MRPNETMRSHRSVWTRGVVALLGGVLVVGSLSACSASRMQRRASSRAKVLEAENVNMRQNMATIQGQLQDAHAGQDAAMARIEAESERASSAQMAASQAREEVHQLAAVNSDMIQTQRQMEIAQRELIAANERLASAADRQRQQNEALRSRPPAPQASTRVWNGGSPQAVALKRDLSNKLRGYGVHDLAVEVRSEGGQERVAVVLPDAFPAGKATLAHNKQAVKAVIGLGALIKNHYPASEVRIEGHTDADPIRRSNWGSNEVLSRARADAVRDLLGQAGVEATRMRTEGYGASRLLDSGSTKTSKSRNRRVEIFIDPRG